MLATEKVFICSKIINKFQGGVTPVINVEKANWLNENWKVDMQLVVCEEGQQFTRVSLKALRRTPASRWSKWQNCTVTFGPPSPLIIVATSLCRGHVDELATEPFLLLHREHGTGYRRSWNCCDRLTCFVVMWKHFCFILSTGKGYRLTLWCALGLLVGGAVQVPQLQLQLSVSLGWGERFELEVGAWENGIPLHYIWV